MLNNSLNITHIEYRNMEPPLPKPTGERDKHQERKKPGTQDRKIQQTQKDGDNKKTTRARKRKYRKSKYKFK